MGGRVGVNSAPGYGSYSGSPAAATATPPSATGPPMRSAPLRAGRVLIAEDNPVNMLIAVAILEQWGLDVTQARRRRQAVGQSRPGRHRATLSTRC